MPKPRVLFVNHTSTMSGAELVLVDVVAAFPGAAAFLFEPGPLAGALAERGLAVTISRHGSGLSSLKRSASLIRTAPPLAGRMSLLLGELVAHCRRHDVIYANSQKAFVLAAIAARLARRPLVWHLHDIISAEHFGASQRRLQVGLANRAAHAVVVPSRAAGDAFIAAGGRSELVQVVPNGLDVEVPSGPRDVLRERLGLPSGMLIGVFSRLARWKGQHVVLEALARLPDVHAIIAGDALFGEEAYAASLRQLAAELGIEQRVHFLGQRRDVPALMRAVDIVVHPSVDPEPFGRTLVEAMLVETPLIATDAGAAADITDHGAAGTLVPPGDAVALAAAIADVLGARERTAAKVTAGLRRARDLYNVAAMRTSIGATVERVAAEGRR